MEIIVRALAGAYGARGAVGDFCSPIAQKFGQGISAIGTGTTSS